MSAPFELRDYQEAAIQKGVKFFEQRSDKHKIEVIPTGGGKSVCIGAIASNIAGKTLVLQPSKEILAQNYKKAESFMGGFKLGNHDLGVYSASFDMRQVRKITFATIGSIVKKPELFKDFQQIIIDECDLVNAKGGQYEKFFDKLGKPVLGLTDSPYRLHPPSSGHNSVIKFIHRTRPKVFHSLLHVTQNRELFDRGYLTRPNYIKEDFHSDQLSFNTTGAEFTDDSIKKYSETTGLVERMARYVRELDAKHVMAACNSLDESRKLQRRLCSSGPEPIVVHGEMDDKERARAHHDFTTGRNRCAIVCGMWTVGFDFPALDAVVNGKITNSARLYKQTVGRGVRTLPDGSEKKFDYVDLGGNVQRFGRVEEFDIVGEPGKERLKSDIGFLTGVDLKTRHDIEAAKANSEDPYMKALSAPRDGSAAMGFGKYKGQQISAVPVGYLYWILKEGMTPASRMMASAEISRRNALKGKMV